MKKEKGKNEGQTPIVNDVKNTGNGEGSVWRNYNGGGCLYDLSESSSAETIGETNSNENGYEGEGCGKVDVVSGREGGKLGGVSKGETVLAKESVENDGGILENQTNKVTSENENPSYTSNPSTPPQSNYRPNQQTPSSKPSYSVYEKEEIIDITNDISPLEEFIRESKMCDSARIALEKGRKKITKNYVSMNKKEHVNHMKKNVLERLYYDLDFQKYVKKNTKIEIERSELDNEDNGQYYKSTLRVKVGNITVEELNVQSTADGSSNNKGETIPCGEYIGYLLNQSVKYKYAISLRSIDPEIVIDDDVLIHANAYTAQGKFTSYSENTGKPCSEGCQILEVNNFTDLTLTLNQLGFKYGVDSKKSWVRGDSIPVSIIRGF